MPSLSRVDTRFQTTFSIIEGGSGSFRGVITEPGQGEVPSYQFNLPRRLLRVPESLPLTSGQVVQDSIGTTFMLGEHGASEVRGEVLFRNFRMFQATGQFSWQKRKKKIDLVTRLETDDGLADQPDVWGVYEPSPEMFDRALRSGFEVGRFITNRAVARDDMVDSRKVSRVDQQLGVYICTLG